MLPFDHKVKVRFLLGFKDGNIFPDEYIPQNAEREVTSRELQMIQQSGAKIQVLGNVIQKTEKKAAKE